MHIAKARGNAVVVVEEMAYQQLKLAIERTDLDSSSIDDWAGERLEEVTHRPQAFSEAFAALLSCLPEASSEVFQSDSGSESVTLRKVTLSLFGLAASQSGTKVTTRDGLAESAGGEIGGGPTCGVLILGFGGASMLQLEPVDKIYATLKPGWKRVMTTQSGLHGPKAGALVRAQLLEAAEALADIDHVYVHAMSNNGYGTWQRIAKATPSLAAKVRGMIFDCGVIVGGALGDSQWHQTPARFEPSTTVPSNEANFLSARVVA